MVSGWFVFMIAACIVVCCGFVLGIALMRAAWAQREREALTTSDLRALEESAVLLIEQLRSEADRSMADLDRRCGDLQALIAEADRKIEALEAVVTTAGPRPEPQTLPYPSDPVSQRGQVLKLSAAGMGPADIARATGLDRAQVSLILSLCKQPAA